MAIIEVEHLTKEYRLGQLESLKTNALNQFRRLTGKPLEQRALFKALDDVSFHIDESEVVGIIGHNGAGKSTLLKLLANITSPTSGQIRVKGRIAPLIEVGAGFVPELTGRENVYLNGSILGLSRKAIASKFDEIVDFAEMAEFIDTPVKRYSSGMKVKLAFSVATSIESEILIVDEVLAVGDLAFQRKCFDRMEGLIRSSGRTVLLVSHNIRQVGRMCNRVLLLGSGRIVSDGPPSEVCDLFYRQSNQKIIAQKEQPNGPASSAHELRTSGEVILRDIHLLSEDGEQTTTWTTGHAGTIRCVFESNKTLNDIEVVYGFHTTDFVYISSMSTAHLETAITLSKGSNIIDCNIAHIPLTNGVFALRVGILDKFRGEIFYGETLKIFEVTSANIPVTKKPVQGLIEVPATWTISPGPHTDERKAIAEATS